MFDWIVSIVTTTGYAGVALLMFAENVFPPIPSELIMPLAGFASARGELSLVGTILAGTAGSLVGLMLWYEAGRRVGLERLERFCARHGRWIGLSPGDVDVANGWFSRHGGPAVLFGRLVPTVRTLISVPAGFARMGRVRFLLWSAVGTGAWTTLLAGLGYVLADRYERVIDWVNPVANVVVVVLVAGYLYRVATFDRRARREGGAAG